MLRQKQCNLVIENVLWRNFIEVRMLGTTSQLYVTLRLSSTAGGRCAQLKANIQLIVKNKKINTTKIKHLN